MTKEQLTRAFMAELGIPEDQYKACLWSWWQNPISATSLRLTEPGYHIVKDRLNIEHYAMKVESSLGRNLKIYLQLDRLITSPFYIQHRSRVVFFGQQDAVMMQLISGDLDQYLRILGD